MRRLIESRVEYTCTRASERAIRCARVSVCAYRLVSIYPDRGLRSTGRGTDPIVRLTNIVLLRPAFEPRLLLFPLTRHSFAPSFPLPPSLSVPVSLSLSLPPSLSPPALIRLCFCHFLFSNVARSRRCVRRGDASLHVSEKRRRRAKKGATGKEGTVTRGISGRANLEAKVAAPSFTRYTRSIRRRVR